jgi:Ca-activated chloride channel family protein
VAATTRSRRPTLFWGFCMLSGFAFLLFLGFLGHSFSLQSQSPPARIPEQATISVDTALVVLPVSVTDADGNFISGLNQQDFRVYEEGRPQEVTLFQEEDAPGTIGLIVDHSRSMGPKLPAVAAAVSAFARSSNRQDEMFVVNFNDQVSLKLPGGGPFTSDPNELQRDVSASSAQGQTALYDALTAGLNHLQLARWDKRALIIVSDGGDNASEHKYSDVLALARRSQAVIYSIGLLGADTEDENPQILRRLSHDTGGVSIFPASNESVLDASAKIARDLRAQYTVGFAARKTNSGHSFRKIEVKVAASGHGKTQVRTRLGYYVTPEQKSVAQGAKNAS